MVTGGAHLRISCAARPAGREVSPASVRRPTTDEAVAWVPQGGRTAVADLLEWLGVRAVEEHESWVAAGVAVVDLPHMDSRESAHRARVEAILPRDRRHMMQTPVDVTPDLVDPVRGEPVRLVHDEHLGGQPG